MDTLHRADTPNADPVPWGILAIALGFFLLADNTPWFTLDGAGRFWPVLVIALGAAKLTQRIELPDGNHERRGAALLFVGLWGLLTELQIGGLTVATAWPLLVVAAGFWMVQGSVRSGHLCGLAAGRRRHAA